MAQLYHGAIVPRCMLHRCGAFPLRSGNTGVILRHRISDLEADLEVVVYDFVAVFLIPTDVILQIRLHRLAEIEYGRACAGLVATPPSCFQAHRAACQALGYSDPQAEQALGEVVARIVSERLARAG